ncbi:MAG: hypothetical protein WC378_03365 [Opitutaceae bacterium]|jgi:hypothetical protein
MPKVQRSQLPPALLAHLLDRIQSRHILPGDLQSLASWLDTNPTVPNGDWFKRFQSMTICGNGSLIKTFLTPGQTAIGKEVQ